MLPWNTGKIEIYRDRNFLFENLFFRAFRQFSAPKVARRNLDGVWQARGLRDGSWQTSPVDRRFQFSTTVVISFRERRQARTVRRQPNVDVVDEVQGSVGVVCKRRLSSTIERRRCVDVRQQQSRRLLHPIPGRLWQLVQQRSVPKTNRKSQSTSGRKFAGAPLQETILCRDPRLCRQDRDVFLLQHQPGAQEASGRFEFSGIGESVRSFSTPKQQSEFGLVAVEGPGRHEEDQLAGFVVFPSRQHHRNAVVEEERNLGVLLKSNQRLIFFNRSIETIFLICNRWWFVYD